MNIKDEFLVCYGETLQRFGVTDFTPLDNGRMALQEWDRCEMFETIIQFIPTESIDLVAEGYDLGFLTLHSVPEIHRNSKSLRDLDYLCIGRGSTGSRLILKMDKNDLGLCRWLSNRFEIGGDFSFEQCTSPNHEKLWDIIRMMSAGVGSYREYNNFDHHAMIANFLKSPLGNGFYRDSEKRAEMLAKSKIKFGRLPPGGNQ